MTQPASAAHGSRPALPVVSFETLWHVGTLDPADKGSRFSGSYEGQGLSVSLHPHDWIAIARLGGLPTWRLTRTANAFLDYHRLTPAQRAQITAWGVEHGYVEYRSVWKVRFFDDELGYEAEMRFATEDEALDEAEVRECEVEQVVVPVATDAFPDPTVRPGDIDPHQVLTVAWVAQFHPDLDGVWWDDNYDPAAYSCPRGTILADRLPRWTSTLDA